MDRYQTFRNCRTTIPLLSLKISTLYIILYGYYESPNAQNRMCELCTFSQIQSQLFFQEILLKSTYYSQNYNYSHKIDLLTKIHANLLMNTKRIILIYVHYSIIYDQLVIRQLWILTDHNEHLHNQFDYLFVQVIQSTSVSSKGNSYVNIGKVKKDLQNSCQEASHECHVVARVDQYS